jgi:hypothetical protein
MRTVALLMTGLLLNCSLSFAQTNITGQTNSARWGFPRTGISSTGLAQAIEDVKQVLPTNGITIISMWFPDSDNALIRVRRTSAIAGGVRDVTFQRAGGKWNPTGDTQARPSDYPEQGITPAELDGAFREIKKVLPVSGILEMRFPTGTEIDVRTGVQWGPRAGRGGGLSYRKKDGKWQTTGGGEWVS